MKIGDIEYEWVLVHARNGEQYCGLVKVADDLSKKSGGTGPEQQEYYRAVAADVMQPKVFISTNIQRAESASTSAIIAVKEETNTDRIIELRNPHQVVMAVGGGGGGRIATVPLSSLGNNLIFLRSQELMFIQFLDDSSPLVKEIRANQSKIIDPTTETRTAGGIVLPGGAKI